ncbi:MAG: 16S rRNA (uracil(1498)-N(3))-methyltransferase [Bacteroidales bacterium]|nr:16S rRNA (uracil(1498)-N(3))-methyltransferase [Bacteroidales bacterium]
MYLFHTPDINSDIYTLNKQESKHCIKVLRLKTGDKIHLTDGNGNLYESVLLDTDFKKCSVEIKKIYKEYGKRDYKIHIAVAPTKNIGRFEWFLEKATEIGIDEITPVFCEHSERTNIKTERLNKIITSAVKQSLKAYHPKLNNAVKFKGFIKGNFSDRKYIAFCDKENSTLLNNIYQKGQDALILIGPEGDFGKIEIQSAKDSGFIPISLGESRLRTETAALVACHIINLLNEK